MSWSDQPGWRAAFTPRQLKEIDFCVLYAEQFNHGTDGHNAKLIIAQMAKILDLNDIQNLPPMPADYDRPE